MHHNGALVQQAAVLLFQDLALLVCATGRDPFICPVGETPCFLPGGLYERASTLCYVGIYAREDFKPRSFGSS